MGATCDHIVAATTQVRLLVWSGLLGCWTDRGSRRGRSRVVRVRRAAVGEVALAQSRRPRPTRVKHGYVAPHHGDHSYGDHMDHMSITHEAPQYHSATGTRARVAPERQFDHRPIDATRGKCCAHTGDEDRTGAHSVAASYKLPMLVTRVRLPVCAHAWLMSETI